MIRRRKPIRYKRKVKRVLWRSGRVIEDSAGMVALRRAAFQRSEGRCECWRYNPQDNCGGLPVYWAYGHLHHILSRGRGGSDVLSNVAFIRRDCHIRITGDLQWSKRLGVGE